MLVLPMLLVALIFGIMPNVIFTDLHVAVTQLLYAVEPVADLTSVQAASVASDILGVK